MRSIVTGRPDNGLVDPLVDRLRAAGSVWAEEEAALLRSAATGEALESLVVRRLAGEPVEVLVGWAELCGVRVATAPGVFVPRARSALLVELALAHLTDRDRPVVVDLGCGTGALGAAIAHHRPDAEVHAADVDPAAVACAQRNLPPEHVHEGDLYAALPERLERRVDALVVNAPYVPSGRIATMPPEARDHEHRLALDGGPDGLDVQRRVARDAPRWLAPGGVLLLETGRDQAAATAHLVGAAGLEPMIHTDDTLDATVVSGRAGRAAGY